MRFPGHRHQYAKFRRGAGGNDQKSKPMKKKHVESQIDTLAFLMHAFKSRESFWQTDDGKDFRVPEEIRYKWYLELLEERHKMSIKLMWDRQSLTWWMERLYPLACAVCAAIDPANLIWYILTAFGGNGALKLNKTFSKASFQKNNPNERYKPIKLRNGGNGEIEVDVKKPNIVNPVTGDEVEPEEEERGD